MLQDSSTTIPLSSLYVKIVRVATCRFFYMFNRLLVTPGWKVGKNVVFRGPLLRYSSFGNVSIGSNSLLGAFCLVSAEKDADIVIGSSTSINFGTHIVASKKIVIGDNTRIGEYCCIRDSDHGKMEGGERGKEVSQEVIIGRNVWIGAHVTILKGVAIGDGATVGAGAVVTKNVSALTTVVGVPAKPITMT